MANSKSKFTQVDAKELASLYSALNPRRAEFRAWLKLHEALEKVSGIASKVDGLYDQKDTLEKEIKSVEKVIADKREAFEEEARSKQEGLEQALANYREGKMAEIETAIKNANEQIAIFTQKKEDAKKSVASYTKKIKDKQQEYSALTAKLEEEFKVRKEGFLQNIQEIQESRDKAQLLANEHLKKLSDEKQELMEAVRKLKTYIEKVQSQFK